MMKHILISACLIFCSFPAVAAAPMPGPVTAEVTRVLDGDTFDVRARIWLGHVIETRIRLRNLDTPELRSRCIEEKQRAEAAKTYLENIILHQPVILTQIRHDKYAGRVIADVETMDGSDLSSLMITVGHGRPYDGGRRQSWCPDS